MRPTISQWPDRADRNDHAAFRAVTQTLLQLEGFEAMPTRTTPPKRPADGMIDSLQVQAGT
jgi:hypothetical protein